MERSDEARQGSEHPKACSAQSLAQTLQPSRKLPLNRVSQNPHNPGIQTNPFSRRPNRNSLMQFLTNPQIKPPRISPSGLYALLFFTNLQKHPKRFLEFQVQLPCILAIKIRYVIESKYLPSKLIQFRVILNPGQNRGSTNSIGRICLNIVTSTPLILTIMIPPGAQKKEREQ